MKTNKSWWRGVVVLAWVGMLGCSTGRDTERSPAESSAPAAASAPEAPDTQPPPSGACAGICYREVDGGCETMPTCCPRTVHLKTPPHCPPGYTLDMNSGPERCAVHHLCVD